MQAVEKWCCRGCAMPLLPASHSPAAAVPNTLANYFIRLLVSTERHRPVHPDSSLGGFAGTASAPHPGLRGTSSGVTSVNRGITGREHRSPRQGHQRRQASTRPRRHPEITEKSTGERMVPRLPQETNAAPAKVPLQTEARGPGARGPWNIPGRKPAL